MSRKLLPIATAIALAAAALAVFTVGSRASVSARLVPKQGETLAAGVFAPSLQVAVKNSERSPIVLRGVEWENYHADYRSWLTVVYGAVGESDDGSIVHNTMAQSTTGIKFETGLILPGEERLVPAPITPQGSRHRLIVKYAVVGDKGDWKKDVLLPQGEGPAGMIVEYVPATLEAIRARKGKATGDAAVRSTCKPDAVPLPVHTQTVQLSLPLETSPDHRETGGLSRDTAARKAGIPASDKAWWAFYREPLHAWFFTRSNGTAVALRLIDGKWKRVPLPKMDIAAPDEFCKSGEATLLVLRPETFKDLVKVSIPSTHMGWYHIGPTNLAPKSVWAVLERARERNIALRFVVFDENGLGNSSQLIAGVVVDKSGRWIDPKVNPREEF